MRRFLTIALVAWLALRTPAQKAYPAAGDLPQSMIFHSGMIVLFDSGSCPSGFTEISSTGNYLLFTSSANGDAGTTGGSLSYTPAGTNGTVSFTPSGTNGTASFTPSGTVAWPAGVPTFSGSALGTHSHGAGTLADATSGSTVKLFTASGSGVSAATLSGSTAAVTAGTPSGTVAWPAGVPTLSGSAGTVPAETFTGSSGTVPAETFTGTLATIQPTFEKLIGCKKQ